MEEIPLLSISNLSVLYDTRPVVMDVTITVGSNEIVGIVGESGSGKTTLLRSVADLLPSKGVVKDGSILFRGKQMIDMQKIRGNEIGFVFQNPEGCFDPIMKIEQQFYECVHVHSGMNRVQAWEKAKSILSEMGITQEGRVLDSFPSELSGGMLQRTAIAIAAANDPKLLLADEPTSALDVSTTVKVIEVLLALRRNHGTSILFVTHNMRMIAKMADKVGVMQKGKLVEWGTPQEVLHSPKHPYTQELINAVPTIKQSGKIRWNGY
jgi:peptide/nickel transport system ATP-binding protein